MGFRVRIQLWFSVNGLSLEFQRRFTISSLAFGVEGARFMFMVEFEVQIPDFGFEFEVRV